MLLLVCVSLLCAWTDYETMDARAQTRQGTSLCDHFEWLCSCFGWLCSRFYVSLWLFCVFLCDFVAVLGFFCHHFAFLWSCFVFLCSSIVSLCSHFAFLCSSIVSLCSHFAFLCCSIVSLCSHLVFPTRNVNSHFKQRLWPRDLLNSWARARLAHSVILPWLCGCGTCCWRTPLRHPSAAVLEQGRPGVSALSSYLLLLLQHTHTCRDPHMRTNYQMNWDNEFKSSSRSSSLKQWENPMIPDIDIKQNTSAILCLDSC